MTLCTVRHRFDGDEEAPVLVLAGSLGTTVEMWEPQVAALSTRFRLLRYDHPGHGASPVPDGAITIDDLGEAVLALLDRLGLERVSFCGLSLGGSVGIWLASRAPGRIDRLTLCCTAARYGAPEGWLERAETVRDGGLEAIVDAVVDGRWFTPEFRAARREVVERFRRMFLSTPREGYARCCEALAVLDLREDVARIEAPTLLVWGSEDPVVSAAARLELAHAISASRLVELSPAAHLAPVEQPDAFAAALVEHLATAAAA